MVTSRKERGPMRIGILAPPWLSVPPPGYGGTESVVDRLARGLESAGHHVRLWTTGDSSCPVTRNATFESGRLDLLGSGIVEMRHAIEGYAWLVGEGCDLVHDHTTIGPFARPPDLPVVVTNHSPFGQPELTAIFRRLGAEVPVVAVSHDQASSAARLGIDVSFVIHHGIDVSTMPFGDGGGDERGPYLLFLGRMNPDKGVGEAIDVAIATGMRLVIAAKVREPVERDFYRDVIAPRCRDGIEYVGEPSTVDRDRLLGGAAALLNPIQWPEPFGLVMIEALAAGTPVIATRHGAAPEIVRHGRTGFVCGDHDGLVRAVRSIDRIDRRGCRADAARRFSVERMVARHLDAYRTVIGRHTATISTQQLSLT